MVEDLSHFPYTKKTTQLSLQLRKSRKHVSPDKERKLPNSSHTEKIQETILAMTMREKPSNKEM